MDERYFEKKKVSVEKLVKTRELKFSKGKSAGANWC
jgi:hypothetical protein